MGGRVSIRSLSEHRWSLVREGRSDIAMTAADALAILGGWIPVIAWDDSGPGGELVFPVNSRTAVLLRDQLNDALEYFADFPAAACPAESFPEPGDFAEPAGGEAARVASEEAAWEAQIRADAAAATPAAAPADRDRAAFNGWKSGDRFVVLDRDDAARAAAAAYLWPVWWGGASAGHVISRCDMHLAGHHTVPGLLVDCEGMSRPTVIAAATLSACARKVGA